VILPLTIMNEQGKRKARVELEKLDADGNTNLWDGLVAGLNLLKGTTGNSSLFLLTDGEPTRVPAGGHEHALIEYKKANPFSLLFRPLGLVMFLIATC